MFGVFDLYIASDAANAVSGEQLMGDRPADAASPPPGELCRIATVTRDPYSFLLVAFLTLTPALALTERFVSVTLVLAGDTPETVDESLHLFGVYVSVCFCLCFGSRV